MRNAHFLDAFRKLGAPLPEGSRLELARGAAMILGGQLERATEDADVILMKLYAMWVGDIEDLRALEPAEEELSWVEGQLERIAKFREDRAHGMELYLRQHDTTERESKAAEPEEHAESERE